MSVFDIFNDFQTAQVKSWQGDINYEILIAVVGIF